MKVLPILLLVACVIFTACSPEHILKRQAQQTVSRSERLLSGALPNGENPVPEGLLSRTLCAATVKIPEDRGVVACRRSPDAWSLPVLLSFLPTPQRQAPQEQEFLVLLTSARAEQALVRGGLRLGPPPLAAPGPLAEQMPTFTDADLTADTFVYVREKNTLAGSRLSGTLHADESRTRAFYDGKLDSRAALARSAADGHPAKDFASSVESFFNAITPVGIIIHHSAVLPGDTTVPSDPREIDEYHQARGFAVVCSGKTYHVAYHYLIMPDGKVVAGRPERCHGAHARGYAAYLGISLVGDFSSADNPSGKKGLTHPTAKQLQSLIQLCRRLMRQYHIPLQRVLRHSDVTRTRCPGDRFPFGRLLRQLE